jgi:hypothetical protein
MENITQMLKLEKKGWEYVGQMPGRRISHQKVEDKPV